MSVAQWVTVRIPKDLDGDLEKAIAGTSITKKEAVEMALRDWLKVERPSEATR